MSWNVRDKPSPVVSFKGTTPKHPGSFPSEHQQDRDPEIKGDTLLGQMQTWTNFGKLKGQKVDLLWETELKHQLFSKVWMVGGGPEIL